MPNQPRAAPKRRTKMQRERIKRAKATKRRFESIDALQKKTGLSLEESLAISLNREPLDPL